MLLLEPALTPTNLPKLTSTNCTVTRTSTKAHQSLSFPPYNMQKEAMGMFFVPGPCSRLRPLTRGFHSLSSVKSHHYTNAAASLLLYILFVLICYVLITGYPLALLHRLPLFYSAPSLIKHLLLFLEGASICYYNFGKPCNCFQ